MKNSNTVFGKSSATFDRIGHIDVAKAIGMVLIVFSHVRVDSAVATSTSFILFDSVINSFYVPLFFLLSGVFDPKELTWSKFMNRCLTLTKFIAIFSITGILAIGILYSRWDISSIFKGSLCWFIITLLWINVLNIPVRKCRYGWVFIAVYVVAGCCLSYMQHSFFYIGQSLVCYPFFALGRIAKTVISNDDFKLWRLVTYWGGWFLLWLPLYSSQNVSLNLIGQPFVAFYAEAVLGSLGIVELSKLISWAPLNYFGRYSIIPMWAQMPLILAVSIFFVPSSFVVYLLTASVITICCGLLIPLFRNRHFAVFSPVRVFH